MAGQQNSKSKGIENLMIMMMMMIITMMILHVQRKWLKMFYRL